MWLRADYIPMKSELMNYKIDKKKISNIKHIETKEQKESVRDIDDTHVVYQMHNWSPRKKGEREKREKNKI